DFDIKYTLKLLMLEIEKKELADQQIAVQVITPEDFSTLDKYEYQQSKLNLEQQFHHYAKASNGTMIHQKEMYYLYSTKQFLNHPSTFTHFFNLMDELDFQLFSGIGFGKSVYQAEINAEKALASSRLEESGNLYILDDQYQLRGPFTHASFSLDEPVLD